MNERTTLEIIAPTVEEALAQGLSQLGLPADAVSVEVLDAGNKGLFGLGGRQVRVRLTVNGPEGAPAFKTEPASGSKPEAKPVAPKSSEKRKRTDRPAQSRPAAVEGGVEAMTTGLAQGEAEIKVETHPEHDQLLDKTEEIISKLINHMGLRAQVSAHYGNDDQQDRRSIHVDIRGDDLSSLIGRHAETLMAFQHIASLMVGKELEQWVQLIVDVEGYRSRREKQLQQLARRLAEQVIKTGRRATLEPMPSNERRVIHIELRGHPAVMTESVGEEPYRKIVIMPKE
jgi:spoIIIJ-associated protein